MLNSSSIWQTIYLIMPVYTNFRHLFSSTQPASQCLPRWTAHAKVDPMMDILLSYSSCRLYRETPNLKSKQYELSGLIFLAIYLLSRCHCIYFFITEIYSVLIQIANSFKLQTFIMFLLNFIISSPWVPADF